jgi:aspartyl-tRNA(Asn)/glutamyl-tRNA(Gln) amidotransferase subunit A
MHLTELTLSEACILIENREIAPVELAQAFLERIQVLDGRLNCFITVTADLALQRARQAEAQLRATRRGATSRRFSLLGIPLALKDLYATRGLRTTAGSTFFADYLPEENAFVVEKLERLGVVWLGKLNMHEIALGLTNVNPHYGACHNPWDTERVPGGSSGGSAAALAARLCMGSLGSDTGGSIRVPAALCGIVGLKPTRGRVSLGGVIPLSWSADHAGPMARSVRDVAILLNAIAGYDPHDPACEPALVPDYLESLEAGVEGLRVGLAQDAYFGEGDPEVIEAVQQAARLLASLGAQLSPVSLPDGLAAARANALIVTSEAAAFHRQRLETNPAGFGADILQRLQLGAANSAPDYALARRKGVEHCREYARLFEQYDLLLTPTTPNPAPLIAGQDALEQARQLTRFTAPFNLTGLPAISLPCGFTSGTGAFPAGLPIGLQMIAPPWMESRLLQAAYAYEQATSWHTRQPAL